MSRQYMHHKPTPCSPLARAQLEFASLAGCVSECQQGLADNNACTTHAVHSLAGEGRACLAGEMGRDGQGNCIAAFGPAKQAYDFFVASCASGGANQSEQCRAAAAAVVQLQPGALDTSSAEHARSCPDGRTPCAAGSGTTSFAARGEYDGNTSTGGSCVEWCTRAGVPDGVPVCSADGTKADGLKGRWVSTSFAGVPRDPTARAYDPALAEIATHFDAHCRHLANSSGFGFGAVAGGTGMLSADARAPIGTQLEIARRAQCATARGQRNYACEAAIDVRADRELLEELAIRQLQASSRNSPLRSHALSLATSDLGAHGCCRSQAQSNTAGSRVHDQTTTHRDPDARPSVLLGAFTTEDNVGAHKSDRIIYTLPATLPECQKLGSMQPHFGRNFAPSLPRVPWHAGSL